MSVTLVTARQGLRQVQSQVKQGNSVAAVQAVQNALSVMRGALMQSERKELSALVDDAVFCLSSDPLIKQIYPSTLKYTAGDEAALSESLRELQASMTAHVQEEAEEAQRATDAKKRATFERGKQELSSGNPLKGKATFNSLRREFPQDAMLLGDMGEALLAVKMYEEAVEFLSEALDLREDMVSGYNNIGIALRELKRFDTAEVYYLRASEYLRTDPNLYFNIARLYLDWGKMPKSKQAITVALKLDPNFVEAQKLLRYLEKIIAAQSAKG